MVLSAGEKKEFVSGGTFLILSDETTQHNERLNEFSL